MKIKAYRNWKIETEFDFQPVPVSSIIESEKIKQIIQELGKGVILFAKTESSVFNNQAVFEVMTPICDENGKNTWNLSKSSFNDGQIDCIIERAYPSLHDYIYINSTSLGDL